MKHIVSDDGRILTSPKELEPLLGNSFSAFSTWTCGGKEACYEKTLACLVKTGRENCLECGKYHTCGDCGVGHSPGECNLGITAEEVANLIIPYCDVERLDLLRNSENK